MNITNIIIIAILIIIILWILSSTIFKTNIVMDLITDCNEKGTNLSESVSYSGSYSNNPNYVDKSIIDSYKSQNMMLSMWFYIESWETNTSNKKNILYIAKEPSITNVDIDSNTLTDLSCISKSNSYKNISVELDNFENNLNIYVLCSHSNRCTNEDLIMSKYKISNIPIQKWNNLTLSIDAKLLDVYLDGKLLNSFVLPNIIYYPKSTDQNIYLGYVDGTSQWNGFITRVRFEPNSITPKDALDIYNAGINSNHTNSLLSKYSLKVSFLEYNKEKGSVTI
jgi:hypothetical protein